MRAIVTCFFTLILLVMSLPAKAQNFRRLMQEGDELLEQRLFFEAIEKYNQALERRARNSEVLAKLGNAYRITNQMEEASAIYARAVEARKPEPGVYFFYGQVLKALQQYEEAKKWFLRYAEEDAEVGGHFAETADFALFQRGRDNGVRVSNAPINSPSDAYGPTFHPQGLVFSSTRYNSLRPAPSPAGGQTYQQPNELFLSIRNAEGQYLEARPLLRNQGLQGVNIGPVALSSDGTQVAYTRNNFMEGVRHIPESGMKLDLFLGAITPDGSWAGDQPFPFNGPEHSNGFPSFSPDGNALYFASNLPSGYGGYDIYVSYRDEQGWSPPQNLGPTVNTRGNEISPFFDGVQLFFASDWHPGLGGYDLFRAERDEDGSWAQIFHLGSPISSPRDDYSAIYDAFQNVGFLSSNREGGRGGLDIYKLQRPAENIVLRVEYAGDGSPIEGAIIDFSNCGEGLRQTNERGIFQFPAADPMNCQLVVRKEAYRDEVVSLESQGREGSQEIVVAMNRRNEEFVGRITDYQTGLPIPSATVSAINQSTGQVITASAEANGDYRLGLAPNAFYLVSYSAPGYRVATRSLSVQEGDDPGMLGSVSLLASSSPLPAGVSSADEIIDSPPVESVSTTSVSGADVLPAGYAIQVAALNQPTLDRFSNLASFGKVYSVPDAAGRHRVRVGVFATRSQAEQALPQVRQAGHPRAFVVEEAGGVPPESASRGGGAISAYAPPAATGASTAADNYRIQIGAFRQAYNFPDWKLESLGRVVDRQRGSLTVKYLAGFATLQEARQALGQVHNAGFSEAYVVENRGGNWQKVQ